MILSLFRIVRHSYHPHTAVLVNDEKVRDVKTILVLVITAMLIAVPSPANRGHAIRSRAGWSGGLRPISATQLEVW